VSQCTGILEDEEDMEHILEEFVPKKRGERKVLKKKEGETD